MNKKIYFLMVALGFGLILLAIMPIMIRDDSGLGLLLTSDLLNNILISLGCGIITSTLVSFYIERSNKSIAEQHSEKMKRNILNDLIETVKNYSDEDFDFIKIENVIKTDLLNEIVHSCEMYIPMGIQFYTDIELKTMKELQYSSMSFINLRREQSAPDLYEKYTAVFSEAVNYKFEYGPYSEEEKMKRVCRVLNLSYDETDLCKIGEIICSYRSLNNSYTKFLDIFSHLK